MALTLLYQHHWTLTASGKCYIPGYPKFKTLREHVFELSVTSGAGDSGDHPDPALKHYMTEAGVIVAVSAEASVRQTSDDADAYSRARALVGCQGGNMEILEPVHTERRHVIGVIVLDWITEPETTHYERRELTVPWPVEDGDTVWASLYYKNAHGADTAYHRAEVRFWVAEA